MVGSRRIPLPGGRPLTTTETTRRAPTRRLLAATLALLFLAGTAACSTADAGDDSASSEPVEVCGISRPRPCDAPPNRHEKLDLPAGVNYSEIVRDLQVVAGIQAARYADAVKLVNFYDGIWNQYVSTLEAQRTYDNGGGTIVSGPCGGATNGADAFIARESGGDPNVWNGSGSSAWGCYQIIDSTWASSCSDLGAHGSAPPEVQAQCASRLPLSAWSASGPT